MGRKIRTFSRPQATTAETLQKTLQSRFLLRPGAQFNRLVIGLLAQAQDLYPIQIHAFSMMSNHYHLLATYSDPQQMADFHRYFNGRLSKLVGSTRGWEGTVFPRRYHHVELSQEPEVELARLRYIISQGTKEDLCASPLDWPGVSSTAALVKGETMKGVWIDRNAYRAARNRGESVAPSDFYREIEVQISPVRSLAHLPPRKYRRLMLEIAQDIENEAGARHASEGTTPLGTEAVLCKHPHHRPDPVDQAKRVARPGFHAFQPKIRRAMQDALLLVIVTYREAAERLKNGDRRAVFPAHTFPSGLPFEMSGSPKPQLWCR